MLPVTIGRRPRPRLGFAEPACSEAPKAPPRDNLSPPKGENAVHQTGPELGDGLA